MDVIVWGRAVVSLLGLGLVMGFSPTLYAYTLHSLTAGRGAARAIGGMVTGLAVASTAMAVLFQFVDPDNLARLVRHRVDALLLERGVDLLAGAVLLVAGVAVLVLGREGRMHRRPARHHKDRSDDAAGPRFSRGFVFGLTNTLIGFSGVATMYIAGRVASGVSTDLLLRALAYVPFLVTLVGPYLLLLWVWGRFPALAKGITRVYDKVSSLDLRRPAGIALVVAGVTFLAFAVWAHRG